MYISVDDLIQAGSISEWTFSKLDISFTDVSERGIVLWCHKNVLGNWTMLSGNKFGFESPEDALIFKIQFGNQ